jgi:hypothetical protein
MSTRTDRRETSTSSGGTEMSAWSSLRFRDAPIGVIGLLSVALAVILLPFIALSQTQPSLNAALGIVFFLFAPATLSALYSLFFERSKVYGGFDLGLAAIVVLVQPFTWYWVILYVPVALVFLILCVVVWLLERNPSL